MNYLMPLNSIPLGEGFGFNGNILETNILNLAVVLGIVVSLGGDTLRSLLQNRKQNIANNLQQAEKRAEEAKQELAQAKAQLQAAQERASSIREQGNSSAEKEKKDSVLKKKEEISRLTNKKEETLRVEEQKAVSQVYQQLVNRVISSAKNRLATRLDSTSHASIINLQIVLLAKYKTQ
uniref:CF0 subunit I of ATP synthase n=1 Tax=Calidiella yingdensis TaxID=3031288 RepID=UPI0024115683|nr:CF0 subunit I of ATP synthase [Calidiella yingdensis]WDY13056.1 CF0 subunit I of ATP synthase [Calidiella yingdensis]